MPRGDSTGPQGSGPKTGRRLGYCAGYSYPGFMSRAQGIGYRLGMRFRRGHGRRYYGFDPFWGYPLPPEAYFPPMPDIQDPYDPLGTTESSPEQEINFLKEEAEYLKDELAGIEKRIKDLEREETED